MLCDLTSRALHRSCWAALVSTGLGYCPALQNLSIRSTADHAVHREGLTPVVGRDHDEVNRWRKTDCLFGAMNVSAYHVLHVENDRRPTTRLEESLKGRWCAQFNKLRADVSATVLAYVEFANLSP